MRTKKMQSILAELNDGSADIDASAIISTEGLMLASAISGEVSEDRAGAVMASISSLADRAMREFKLGNLEQLVMKGHNGYALMIQAGDYAALIVIGYGDGPEWSLALLRSIPAAGAISDLLTPGFGWSMEEGPVGIPQDSI
ncbi:MULTISPECIES: roadblock/LC7 domain-containing protein [Acidithiobacillus]|uniref:Dynein regulation protein LC7 n=2 Tax=Acidithiobacillus ferrooxidans TaxID=920 RepID=A0A2W1K6J9_ACIFR|nr:MULTISPECIES: roadblock/LC7 domain-containing protein [Acidithiobacillus]EGQ61336.1 Roadblock/LC7 family protein [Acidithiobacillus sp. GGI-221]MCL5957137.1 roadblock/LC7 domain-containing protein [Gammaproteobacteria bacterium]ACH82819.1 Roadblock/LC7 family protein [Acidithiobacillus ferrooxidans ATCC 53993]MBN6745952.1 roadblock/LC7 domain-containing protein [Acidithiobacillus sp. MC2.2]MBN6748926.1 roadblock/LC7 domain-containing protein [Acidithiobacillus sp. PG05]